MKRLLDELGVEPGMSVLDIGAGTGQLSYLAAERVGPKGVVIASEIEPRLISFIEAEARRRGLPQLKTLKVDAEGFDPAYESARHDLIVLYDVFNFIRGSDRYLRRLRACLKPGGRVVVVAEPLGGYDFAHSDVRDWDAFEAVLENDPSPAVRRGAAALAAAFPLPNPRGTKVRQTLFRLNRLLHSDYFKHYASSASFAPGVNFTEDEEPFARWLIHRLGLTGYPEKRNIMELRYIEVRDVAMLNKLLLIQRYRSHFDSPPPYLGSGMQKSYFESLAPVPITFDQAGGYALDRVISMPPFQSAWVYRAADSH